MGVHANLLIACTQVAGETGLTGIVIFLTEIELQHGSYLIFSECMQQPSENTKYFKH